MGSHELSVSWKDHSSVLVAVFEKLLSNKSLVDCTVAAEGQYLRVHKVVLSACSPYFEVLLNEDIDKHPIIILKDVKFEDLKRIIDFVYKGEVKLPEHQLVDFLNVAESLQIKGLGSGCNEDSGKNKITEELFSQNQSESSKPHNHLSKITDEKSEKSIPSVEIVSEVDSETQWNQPNESANSSPEASVSVSTDVFSNLRDTNTQDVFSSSEVNLLNSSNQITLPAEPLIATSRTIVKVELDGENLETKDNFVYQSIAEEFPETSYVLDTANRSTQPSTSHQYSHLTSGHVSSGDMEEDTLARQQEMDQDCSEGAASDAPLQDTTTNTQRPSGPVPPLIVPSAKKDEEEGGADSKTALHHLFGVSSPYLSSSGAGTPQPPAALPPQPRLPNPLSRAFPATRLRSAAASILSQQNRLHRYHHQGYFYHHRSGVAAGTGGSSAVPKRHYCPECRKPCPSPWYLQRHMRTHTGEKPYRCDSCEMAFSNADNLRRHRRKHTGEDQPFPCEDCGEAFARISALRAHQRAAHTGERPYRCDVCDEAFKQSGHLARHKRTHERHEAVAAAALEAALAGGAPPLDVSGVLHVELVCGEGDAAAGAS